MDVFTENIPNALSYFDTNRIYRFTNKEFLTQNTTSGVSVVGCVIWQGCTQEDRAAIEPHVNRALAREQVIFEYLVTLANSNQRWMRVQFTPDLAHDGSIQGVYSTHIDIHEIKLATAALQRDADWDGLTETYNRNYFNVTLSHALVNAEQSPFALMYLDLDGFKQINDTLGHAVGDELLEHIAQSLKSFINPHDTLARICGDEFALLSHAAYNDAHYKLVKALLEATKKPFRLGDISLSLTASIGIVYVNSSHDLNVRRLLQKADAAMYKDKHAGKNRWMQAQ